MAHCNQDAAAVGSGTILSADATRPCSYPPAENRACLDRNDDVAAAVARDSLTDGCEGMARISGQALPACKGHRHTALPEAPESVSRRWRDDRLHGLRLAA